MARKRSFDWFGLLVLLAVLAVVISAGFIATKQYEGAEACTSRGGVPVYYDGRMLCLAKELTR